MNRKSVYFIIFMIFISLIIGVINTVLIFNKNIDKEEILFDDCYQSVVEIKTEYDGNEKFGTAVCIKDNFLITNWHIINDENSKVFFRSCYSNDYNEAKLISFDDQIDLALIQIDDLRIKTISMSNELLKNGEIIYSLGNTLNQGITLSKGIISNINITYNSLGYICSDNVIDDGNSGGALINSKKELIGITTFKISNLGYAYSIPVKRIIDFINK